MCEVSIIVPVYNAENWIERCVHSILEQTFQDWELVLIDDGSSDNSGKICDQYARNHDNIIVIHQKNAGVSAARNAGLDKCRGKYIMFCDSDDYVRENWIELLVEQIRLNEKSFINIAYEKIDFEKNETQVFKIKNCNSVTHFGKEDYYILEKERFVPYCWNKIYNRIFIENNNIRFNTSLRVSEDAIFNINYFKLCEDIVYIPEVCYEYTNSNQESASRMYDPHYFELLEMLYLARKELIAPRYLQEFYNLYFYRFYQCLDVVMDKRNLEKRKNRIQYCNYILRNSSFGETLKYVDKNVCDLKTKHILELKNYIILLLFRKLAALKNTLICK